jgi:hypothetical protein
MSTKRKTAEAPTSVETFSFSYEAAVGVRMVAGIMTELEARHFAQALTHWGFTGVTIKREPFIPALMVTDAMPRLAEGGQA